MTICIKVYEDTNGVAEFDCPVKLLVAKLDQKNKGRKKPLSLVVGAGSETFRLSVEPIFLLKLG